MGQKHSIPSENLVKVEAPAEEVAVLNRREFAILGELGRIRPRRQYVLVDSAELIEAAKDKGDAQRAKAAKEALDKNEQVMSFAAFVAIFKGFKPKDAEVPTGTGNCLGYAAVDTSGVLKPMKFQRRPMRPIDVEFAIAYCGYCHSDLHLAKNEWGNTVFPNVAGHEIVGIVTRVGAEANGFRIGDRVGLSFVGDTCHNCEWCNKAEEQYCASKVAVCNGKWLDGTTDAHGGFSDWIVSDYRMLAKVPDDLPLAEAAPLLCAGITVWSPMKYYGCDKRGQKVAILGLGGLGHVAAKFAKAFGAELTVISGSSSKEELAKKLLGADHFICHKDQSQMDASVRTFDYIIDTATSYHDLDPYFKLLRPNGQILLVGWPPKDLKFNPGSLISWRNAIGGAQTGSVKEMGEMLQFCSKKKIVCDVEKIPIQYFPKASERLLKSDVKYRFVVDVTGSIVQ